MTNEILITLNFTMSLTHSRHQIVLLFMSKRGYAQIFKFNFIDTSKRGNPTEMNENFNKIWTII